MSEDALQQLVEAYCEDPAPGIRSAIITKALPLVRSIVGKVRKPANNTLAETEDLESAGILGLLQAIESYSPEKNVQFNTFAYYRIRGNIIDYLRKIDQLPRQQRNLYGKVRHSIELLQQQLGREPEDREVAETMDLPLDEYLDVLVNVQQRSVLSMEGALFEGNDQQRVSDSIPDQTFRAPDADLEDEFTLSLVQRELKKLKERDQLILALYYYEEMTLAEIALSMGLTEARISQIVGKILLQLKGLVFSDPQVKS